jgi:ribosomal protein S18 acetylase RimI-like enzyme
MQRTEPAGQRPAQLTDHSVHDIRVARAQPGDIVSLQAAAEASWRATYGDLFTAEFIDHFLARAYSAESLERAFQNRRTYFVVAKVAGEVVAFSQVGPPSHVEDAPPACGELYRLYVRSEWQRRGLGRRLLGVVEDWLAGQRYARYGCYVHARNEQGKAFYWQMGFNRLSRRDLEDEWYLIKELG